MVSNLLSMLSLKATDYLVLHRLLYKYNIYDRGHLSEALPSLRGNALLRHERGHEMLYLYNNLIIIYPYKINRNHADT